MSRQSRNLYLRGEIYWGRFKLAGRQYRRSLLTPDPREAAKRFKAWRKKLERAEIGEPDAPTFKEAVLKWAKEVLPGAVKPAVGKRYLSSVSQLAESMGDLRVTEITSAAVGRYISSRSGVVTNATIRRDLTALSRLLASCVAWGWLEGNPARLFDRSIIREQREPIRPPDPASVAAVMKAAPEGMCAVLALLAATGMRENEAVTLEGGDVDWTGRQITLTRTKTNRPRTLNWRTPGGDAGAALAGLPRAGEMFLNAKGEPYRNFSSNFGQVVRALAARLEGEGRPFRRFRVHDLRHGFAITWLRAGGDIYRLSRHLGHSSVKTTEMYLGFRADTEGHNKGHSEPEKTPKKTGANSRKMQ